MNSGQKIFMNAGQIRAARALLDWSQEDLAEACGLSVATIRKIELGHISPRSQTMGSIAGAFTDARIEFIPPMGVRLRDTETTIIDGDDPYLQLMEEIDESLEDGGEVLFMYANNELTSEAQLDIQLRMRKRKIRFRFLIEENNTYMHYPVDEYRWIPKKFFISNLQLIYGNKVAACMYQGKAFAKVKKIVILEGAPHAASLRNTFEFMWENSRKPGFTTAPRVYE